VAEKDASGLTGLMFEQGRAAHSSAQEKGSLTMAIRGGRPDNRRVVPHLFVSDATKASEFYQRAFGAKELYRAALPGGMGTHVHIKIQESVLLLTEENVELDEMIKASSGHQSPSSLRAPQTVGATSTILEMYTDDADDAFKRAVDAGATVRMPLADMFYGDRYGQVTDPFGHVWALASVNDKITPKQAEKRMQAAFA
jgi:PhnB protein